MEKTGNFNYQTNKNMKKIYAFVCAGLLTFGATAQQKLPMAKEKVRDNRFENNHVTVQSGDHEVFWTNDFSTPANWSINDAYSTGLTQFVDGLNWEIGTGLEPTGGAPIDPLASTTSANGFAMVDSDLFGGEEGGTGIENCWFQTVQPINCSAHPYVSMSFQTFYYMWDNGNSDGNEYCLVEFSTDGVNWPDVTTFEVSEAPGLRYELWPAMSTQDDVANPTVKTFDITAAAGGESTVYMRFRWKGTWGYAWMIDDIQIFDTPENDIQVLSATYSDFNNTGLYEYGAYPTTQIPDFQFRSDVVNIGVEGQTNVEMNVEVNGTLVATSDAISLPYAFSDSLIAIGYTPPATVGTYNINYIVSADATDENPGDNELSASFEVTEFSMGRDDGDFSGVFPADGTEEWAAGPLFQIFNDATVYAIDVAFMTGSELGTEVIASLRDITTETFDPLVQSDELPIVASLLNDGDAAPMWHTFLLTEPVDVFAGDFVMPSIEHYGGANVQIGESRFAPNQTCFVYGAFPDFDWYYTNEVPMVRLNFDEDAENTTAISEIAAADFSLGQNFPNPADDNTRISLTLNNAARVSIEVYDIAGKLVLAQEEGNRAAGQFVIDLNVANLPAGTYQYTVQVADARLSRKMMIK